MYNNPLIPADPFMYDLRWIVGKILQHGAELENLDETIQKAVISALDQHDPIYFENAETLINSGIKAGALAYIEGYHAPGDGGANLYLTTNDYNDIINAPFYITLDGSNLWALPIILTPYVTPEMFGAKGDGTTDDLPAFNIALRMGSVVLLKVATYFLSDTLKITSAKNIKGVITNENRSGNTIILCDNTAIQVLARNCNIENIMVISNNANGLEIGSTTISAQDFIAKNIIARDCGNNGIVLYNCNNGSIKAIKTVYNTNNGFVVSISGNNYSGNVIEILNSYGNGNDGAIINGEANKFYICSQSNGRYNVSTSSYMMGCDVTIYSEFATNGELYLAGNTRNNIFKGTLRPSTNGFQIQSVTGFPNAYLFSDTNEIATTHAPYYNNGAFNSISFAAINDRATSKSLSYDAANNRINYSTHPLVNSYAIPIYKKETIGASASRTIIKFTTDVAMLLQSFYVYTAGTPTGLLQLTLNGNSIYNVTNPRDGSIHRPNISIPANTEVAIAIRTYGDWTPSTDFDFDFFFVPA